MLFDELNLMEAIAYMLPLIQYLVSRIPGILDWLPTNRSVKGSRLFVRQIIKYIELNNHIKEEVLSEFPAILEKSTAFVARIKPPSISSEEDPIPVQKRRRIFSSTEEKFSGCFLSKWFDRNNNEQKSFH